MDGESDGRWPPLGRLSSSCAGRRRTRRRALDASSTPSPSTRKIPLAAGAFSALALAALGAVADHLAPRGLISVSDPRVVAHTAAHEGHTVLRLALRLYAAPSASHVRTRTSERIARLERRGLSKKWDEGFARYVRREAGWVGSTEPCITIPALPADVIASDAATDEQIAASARPKPSAGARARRRAVLAELLGGANELILGLMIIGLLVGITVTALWWRTLLHFGCFNGDGAVVATGVLFHILVVCRAVCLGLALNYWAQLALLGQSLPC